MEYTVPKRSTSSVKVEEIVCDEDEDEDEDVKDSTFLLLCNDKKTSSYISKFSLLVSSCCKENILVKHLAEFKSIISGLEPKCPAPPLRKTRKIFENLCNPLWRALASKLLNRL